MWDLIVSVPDHCLSFYFKMSSEKKKKKMPGLRSYLPQCLSVISQ